MYEDEEEDGVVFGWVGRGEKGRGRREREGYEEQSEGQQRCVSVCVDVCERSKEEKTRRCKVECRLKK